MKNKKLTSVLFALTFGVGAVANVAAVENTPAGNNATTSSYSYQYCTSLFQACEYMGNDLACINFDLYC